jgi:hypothetical protein
MLPTTQSAMPRTIAAEHLGVDALAGAPHPPRTSHLGSEPQPLYATPLAAELHPLRTSPLAVNALTATVVGQHAAYCISLLPR